MMINIYKRVDLTSQSKKEDEQEIKMIKTEPDISKMTCEEEKAALILGITAIFTVWWIFK